MIKLSAIGHLGRDAIVKEVNGKSVINFSIAHTESWKNSEGTKFEKTTWVECAYWSDRTAVAQYLKKGTQVYVEGQPEVDTYTTRDHQTMAKLKLRVGQIQLLGSANRPEQTTQQAAEALVNNQPANEEPADDLPF
jgi:single-strand DNA-binding protein